MKIFCRTVLWALMLLSLTAACARNDTNPIGTDLPDDGWYGDGPFIDTLYVEEDISARLSESAGASPFLLVGGDQDLVSRGILRAALLPDADTISVANLELHISDMQGIGDVTISVFSVTTPDWEESKATWDLLSGTESEDPVPWNTPGGDFDGSTLIGQGIVSSSLIDSTFSIELDPTVVQAWLDTTVSNAGMILVAESEVLSPGIVEFYSRQSVDPSEEDYLGPQLFLEYTKQDDPDSVVEGRISITEDVTLYQFTGEVPPGALRVGSLPQYRSYLRFDVSDYSSDVSIRNATLFLPVQDRFPDTGGIVFGVFNITGEWDAERTPLEFTVLDSVEVGDEEEELELQITTLVWGWVSGALENNGVSLKATVERGKYRYVDLREKGAGDRSGPYCVIEYTTPPPAVPAGPKKERTRD